MGLKEKLKGFFKTRDTSENAAEFLRMFIVPFIKAWSPEATIDDAISAFFAVDDRRFYHGKALQAFRMPGEVMICGNKVARRISDRRVVLGQYMLLAVDRRDQTARIDITIAGTYRTFRVTRPELEFIKDYVEIKEA